VLLYAGGAVAGVAGLAALLKGGGDSGFPQVDAREKASIGGLRGACVGGQACCTRLLQQLQLCGRLPCVVRGHSGQEQPGSVAAVWGIYSCCVWYRTSSSSASLHTAHMQGVGCTAAGYSSSLRLSWMLSPSSDRFQTCKHPVMAVLLLPALFPTLCTDSLRDEAGFRRSYDGHVVLLSRDGDPVEVCLQQHRLEGGSSTGQQCWLRH
jgi:hypothetical protein